MIILRVILSTIFITLIQLFSLIIYLISLPLIPFPMLGRVVTYNLARWSLKFIFALSLVRIKTAGAGIQKRSIYISNYPALFEPLCIISAFPLRVRILAEEAMFNIPILGRVMKAIGCIVLPRSEKDSFGLANAVLKALRDNESVWIFANNSKKMEKAHQLAQSCGATVIQVDIQGSEKVLPKGSLLLNPGIIKISL